MKKSTTLKGRRTESSKSKKTSGLVHSALGLWKVRLQLAAHLPAQVSLRELDEHPLIKKAWAVTVAVVKGFRGKLSSWEEF